MQIGLYTNINKDERLQITEQLVKDLNLLGASVSIYGEASKLLKTKDAFTQKENLEVMIVLGGDGTILGIADFCASNNIPILGLNLGRVGFLTGLELGDTYKLFEILSQKKYSTEKRSMLEIAYNGKKYLALNEVVVSRVSASKMIAIAVNVDGEFVDEFNADGFIVATPTGSTAYSLSAGGPIIAPSSDCLALTAICPHTLHARPIVISGNSVVELSSKNDNCDMILDGKSIGVLNKTELLTIKKSTKQASFISPNSLNFFSRLLSKLNKWGITIQ
ncbi:MAG: NAD(+)/NADH kinase [Firmicutes bacterium]|nr:NAD(+)/NADH kinase [Bacillota bacterium]